MASVADDAGLRARFFIEGIGASMDAKAFVENVGPILMEESQRCPTSLDSACNGIDFDWDVGVLSADGSKHVAAFPGPDHGAVETRAYIKPVRYRSEAEGSSPRQRIVVEAYGNAGMCVRGARQILG